MIPKIIHYCWFSGEEFPTEIKECIDSWHQHMPDWEYRLWDRKAAESLNMRFINEALSVRKWAFAADAVRVYAVYTYGGIYLDTDCKVYQSLEPMLADKAFIGKEVYYYINNLNIVTQTLTSHCFGAEAGHPYFLKCLNYYDNRPFILSNRKDLNERLRYDLTIIPLTQAWIAEDFGFNSSKLLAKEHQYLQEIGLHIYPEDYFDTLEKNIYVRHLCAGSWLPANQCRDKKKLTIKERLK